jgi:formylglycine-generating enzyme required for sulfatase activity
VAARFERFLLYRRLNPLRAENPPALDNLTAQDFGSLESVFGKVMAPDFPGDVVGQVLLEKVQLDSDRFFYAVEYPKEHIANHLYPAIVRLGYPLGENSPAVPWRENLQAMYPDLPEGEPTFLFRAGIIDDVFRPGRLRSSEAASLDVFILATRRWDRFLDTILSKYPIDPSRVYVTGKSYEGVQALSVGLHAPDRIAAVAAFSSVVYPFQVYYRYQHALNCKVLVYGGGDPMFAPGQGVPPGPVYRQQEEEFGRRIQAVAPQNVFRIWDADTHEGVYGRCREAMKEVLGYSRPAYPPRIARRFLLPTEARTEWVTVVQFTNANYAFAPAYAEWDQRRSVSYDRMQTILRCPSLFAEAKDNELDIRAEGVEALDVYLSPRLVNITKPIAISVNGRPAWQGVFTPSVETLLSDFESRRDLRRLSWQRVRISLRDGPAAQSTAGPGGQPLPAGAPPGGPAPRIALDLGAGVQLLMVLIPAGEFDMGSPDAASTRGDDEVPRHRVRITKPFYMAATPVTQRQWEAVMRTRPWGNAPRDQQPDGPAIRVTWYDSMAFCQRLTAATGMAVDLPTEAEWEYACRAGTDTAYSFGSDATMLVDYAWFRGNANDYTHPVGRKKPNAWGLHDMHGNVWQWCKDWWQPDYYSHSPSDDPVCNEPAPGLRLQFRVLRGGSWAAPAEDCRSANREIDTPDHANLVNGFRGVVRP